MAELIVLGFPDTLTADEIAPQLGDMNREGLIDLADWARVIRHADGRVDVPYQPSLIHTSLSPQAEAQLRDAIHSGVAA